jgi:cytochrome c
MTISFKRLGRLGMMCVALVFSTTIAAAQDHGTAEEAQAMVARAIALFDEVGAQATMDAINQDPAPDFLDGDLYVFAYDPADMISAHAVNQSLVGLPVAGFTDVDGKAFGQEISDQATAEGVWVDYKWVDPVSEEIEQKSSWVVRHKDHVFGVGIYKP